MEYSCRQTVRSVESQIFELPKKGKSVREIEGKIITLDKVLLGETTWFELSGAGFGKSRARSGSRDSAEVVKFIVRFVFLLP